MAKYYLQSGSAKLILDCEDSDRASLWFIHRAMESIGSVYEDQTLCENRKLDTAIVESLIDLGPTINISELGFDRDDADKLETYDVVVYWHQLMMALSRLG
jgi:ribosomal protein L7Ae-like RNA K-turn-binding protein